MDDDKCKIYLEEKNDDVQYLGEQVVEKQLISNNYSKN